MLGTQSKWLLFSFLVHPFNTHLLIHISVSWLIRTVSTSILQFSRMSYTHTHTHMLQSLLEYKTYLPLPGLNLSKIYSVQMYLCMKSHILKRKHNGRYIATTTANTENTHFMLLFLRKITSHWPHNSSSTTSIFPRNFYLKYFIPVILSFQLFIAINTFLFIYIVLCFSFQSYKSITIYAESIIPCWVLL